MTSIESAPAAAGVRTPRPDPEKNVRGGVIAALATYGLWGFLPLYFKLLENVDPLAIVANRVAFSLLFVGAFVYFRHQIGELVAALRDRRVVVAMMISSLLVAINWLTFVWAVGEARVLEVSFGYFINPLVSVALGTLLLAERMNRMQWLAIIIAVIAVSIQAIGLGTIPWVSLALAISFALYGYVRKTAGVGSAPGLMIETIVLLPFSLGYIAYLLLGPAPDFYGDPFIVFLLVLGGPATAVPLLMFAYAARQLQLSTIGMFQYIAPTFQFLCAIFLLGETLSLPRLISFALIWVSLVVFSLGSFRRRSAH